MSLFLKFGKQGSTLAGVMDAFSIAISIALQHGVPLETYVDKFTNMRFEPAGMTDDPDIRMAQSIMDYVFRRLALDHLDFDTRSFMGIYSAEERTRQVETGSYLPVEDDTDDDAAELETMSQSMSMKPRTAKEAQPAEVVQHVESPKAGASEVAQSGAGAASAREISAPQVHSSAEPARVAAGPRGRRPDVHELRREDASRRLVPRLRGLRQHQRLQATVTPTRPRPRTRSGARPRLPPVGRRHGASRPVGSGRA
ncbi:hypothetical protein GCM10025868_43940 [Angustibacter aerolatus]|uniref:ribonucleoside-diphosphate reductase n=1 Tax=Angustibacter aerolatus TaxID=1162965 RepID=A0ABQ6JMK0_9ACTN|nr:hypothetical protein GCM10025868_43940 [Angustibacter aerolatus]